MTQLRSIFVCVFLLALFTIPSFAYDIDEDSGSLTLTELDFQNAVKENKYLLVNFHALWCRYSKKLKPEWKNLVETLKSASSPLKDVKTAKVEAYDEKKVAEQYGVEGYPTIKLFIDGTPYDYSGERTQAHILEFLNRMLKTDFTVADKRDAMLNKLNEYEWVGVLVGDSNNDAAKEIAFKNQDIYFVRATQATLKATYSDIDASTATFVLLNNITGKHDVYTESITEAGLTNFINTNKFGAIPKFSKGTAERIFLNDEPALILITDGKGKQEQEFSAAKQDPALKDVFMSVANTNDEISKLLAQNIGVKEFPAVVVVRADRERIRKYKLSGDITKANVVSFYEDYKTKKSNRIFLSEEPPKENNDLVKKVVGDTFDSMVLDKSKDVLLLVWAPWCGHCRAMMPVYDNVARKTREVPNFTVAKIDASVNDLERFGLDIVEYPTILFFTRLNKDEPIEFKGERNEYVFNDFIRSHAAVDLGRMKGPNPFDKNEL